MMLFKPLILRKPAEVVRGLGKSILKDIALAINHIYIFGKGTDNLTFYLKVKSLNGSYSNLTGKVI